MEKYVPTKTFGKKNTCRTSRTLILFQEPCQVNFFFLSLILLFNKTNLFKHDHILMNEWSFNEWSYND